MQKQIQDFILNFTSILYEALPFIVLGALLAGILEELLPQQLVARFVGGEIRSRNPFVNFLSWLFRVFPRFPLPALALCSVLGLIFPMCECGIVVVMRRLLRKGLPLSCCVAYMLAGPIINPVVFASTWVAFQSHSGGYWVIGLRMGLGFLVAVGTALLVESLVRRTGQENLLANIASPQPPAGGMSLNVVEASREPPRSLRQRLSNISETTLSDFIDITVFLIIGALLASYVKVFWLTPDDIRNISDGYPVLMILSMMGLSIALCLCSEADAFVAASFTTMHASGKLAFLVLGPMLDIKLLIMYTRVFRPRLILLIVIALLVQVFVYSMLVYGAWPWLAPVSLPLTPSGG